MKAIRDRSLELRKVPLEIFDEFFESRTHEPESFERQALLISRTPLLLVRGVLQVEQTVVNIRAQQFRALQAAVGAEFAKRHDFH